MNSYFLTIYHGEENRLEDEPLMKGLTLEEAKTGVAFQKYIFKNTGSDHIIYGCEQTEEIFYDAGLVNSDFNEKRFYALKAKYQNQPGLQ